MCVCAWVRLDMGDRKFFKFKFKKINMRKARAHLNVGVWFSKRETLQLRKLRVQSWT